MTQSASVKDLRDFFKTLLSTELQRYKSASKADLTAEINKDVAYKEAFDMYMKDRYDDASKEAPKEATNDATPEATNDAIPKDKKKRVCISRKAAKKEAKDN